MPRKSYRHLLYGIFVPLALAGCGYDDSRAAHWAQIGMIGMTSNDLQACAGPPDKAVTLNDTTRVFQYGYKPGVSGSFSISPLNLATINYGGNGSYCVTNVRLVGDRVTEVHYSGDNDKFIGTDGVCAAIVRGCVRQPEATMRPMQGGLFGPVSAFSAPPVPPQPASAVYNPQPLATAPRLVDKP